MSDKKRKIWGYLFMHLLFLIYSMTSVISRKIGETEPFSREFILGYALIFVCLGLYALGWQQVLKIFPLFQAYSSKAVVVIWGILWGAVIFGEKITPGRILGAALIICGVILFAKDEPDKQKGGEKRS